MDVDTQEIHILDDSKLLKEGNDTIGFNTSELTTNRRYDVTIMADNAAGSINSSTSISKF